MKRFLFFCFILLALPHLSSALFPGQITDYFQDADSIYLVHVDANEKGEAIFSVIETLRGKPVAVLNVVPRVTDLKKNTDWLFLSCAGWRKDEGKDVVGLVSVGDCGWICSKVFREGDKFYLPGVTHENNRQVYDKDLTGHGLPYLTLEHVKRMILKNPENPSPK